LYQFQSQGSANANLHKKWVKADLNQLKPTKGLAGINGVNLRHACAKPGVWAYRLWTIMILKAV